MALKLRRHMGQLRTSDAGLMVLMVLMIPKFTGDFSALEPTGSMYGIYANIGGILMVNVTIYIIHGSYGEWEDGV